VPPITFGALKSGGPGSELFRWKRHACSRIESMGNSLRQIEKLTQFPKEPLTLWCAKGGVRELTFPKREVMFSTRVNGQKPKADRKADPPPPTHTHKKSCLRETMRASSTSCGNCFSASTWMVSRNQVFCFEARPTLFHFEKSFREGEGETGENRGRGQERDQAKRDQGRDKREPKGRGQESPISLSVP